MSRRLIAHAPFCLRRMLQKKVTCSFSQYHMVRRRKSLCFAVEKRDFSHIIDQVGRQEEATPFELDDDGDVDLSLSTRTIIQYDSSDPVISALLGCTTVQDVFNVLDDPKSTEKKEYHVQAVLILWYLQNVFMKVKTQLGNITDVTRAEYTAEIMKQDQFNDLLRRIMESAEKLDIDELTCSLLYLSKIGVDMRSDTMQTLLVEIEKQFKNIPECATLCALSRASVALNYNPELWCQFFLLGISPLVENKIDEVTSPDDLRLLTICFMHSNHLHSESALMKYKKLCEHFIENNLLEPKDGKTIVKMLTFFSWPFWSNCNSAIVRQLGNILRGHVNKLEIKDITAVSKAFQTHMEPAGLVEEVTMTARDYLSSGRLLPDKNVNTGVLYAATQLSTYAEKRKLEKLLYKELDSDYFLSTMISLFQILRSLKTSDHKLCHLFWSKTIETLRKHPDERETVRLIRVANRYMYFNNNMGGTYRHYGFEKQMIAWIMDEIEDGSLSYTPSKLSRGASFLLAYCKDPPVVTSVVNRLLAVGTQLSKVDCVMLSRGLEIMLDLTRRKQIFPDVMEKLVELDTLMNACAWRHLQEEKLSLSEINKLLRTFHNRRASPDSLLFHTMIQRLEASTGSLSSRLIRDLSHCTAGLSYLIPSLLDKAAEYIVANEESVMAETAERVLSSVFYLGYTPASGAAFFDACARLLLRDKDRLTSLSIVQTCLALSFFHCFPPELVSFVFAVDFLERIDQELATCYGKATYPVRVRYTLMELNRSVCLDLPELDVPWFHAKYCEEITALDPGVTTNFHEDVGKQLATVLGNETFLQTGVYSPYGYKINFLILLDAMTKPLIRTEEDRAKQRVAIILHSDRQFTLGDRRLKGPQQLRQRHLEMLGYRVVPIAEFVWNAMYLTEPHAKRTFLAERLWPER